MVEIKETIETHFGSEEEFVKRAVSGAGKSFVEFLTPEQIESLTSEQLKRVPREVLLRALELQEKS